MNVESLLTGRWMFDQTWLLDEGSQEFHDQLLALVHLAESSVREAVAALHMLGEVRQVVAMRRFERYDAEGNYAGLDTTTPFLPSEPREVTYARLPILYRAFVIALHTLSEAVDRLIELLGPRRGLTNARARLDDILPGLRHARNSIAHREDRVLRIAGIGKRRHRLSGVLVDMMGDRTYTTTIEGGGTVTVEVSTWTIYSALTVLLDIGSDLQHREAGQHATRSHIEPPEDF